MNAVFLDLVGMLALGNVRDQWHAAATEALRPLQTAKVRTVTTTLVLYECGNAASRMSFRSQVGQTRRVLVAAGNLFEPTAEDLETAWTAYDRGDSGSASIVDRVSFVVMRRLGITRAFTIDRHFRAAGFELLF